MEKLRPCVVSVAKRESPKGKEERRGYFHRWEDVSTVLAPSVCVGGHAGGVERMTLAIVELEDGTVVRAYPYQIKFTDRGQ